ncbi:hypothetical protein C8Q74DRAFT_1310679 [Fomes fomentarius]|nr:hypothetical protein C8Q74DRAFT_1310679 [Fomes fomentarius]
MSGKGYESWGFTASIISTIFLVPLLYAWTKGPLPSTKIREMESLLLETQNLLLSAIQEGTITYQLYESKLEDEMWAFKVQADTLRAEIYNIKSTWHELRLWKAGLSQQIANLMDGLYTVRGKIAASSSRGRAELSNMGCTTNPTLAIYSIDRITHLTLPAPLPDACAALPPYSKTHRCTLASRPGAVQSSPHSHLLAIGCSCYPHAANTVGASPPAIQGESATASAVRSSLCEAHAVPSLAFPSQEKTTMERPHPAQDVPPTHENKVNYPLDARASWQAASPVPSRPRPIKGKNKNNGSNRLSVFVGFFRRSSDMTLPRQTGFFSYPFSTQTTSGNGEPGMLGSGRKGVVAEVQLPV